MNSQTNLMIIITALCALLAGVWFGYSSEENRQNMGLTDQIQGMILTPPKIIDPFELTDHHGQPLTNKTFKDRWSLLFIGYSQCPDVCPAALTTLKSVHTLMQEQELETPAVIFISIDPERDTPEILRQYVTYFNDDFIAATSANTKVLDKLADNLSIYYRKVPGMSGDIKNDDYLMEHSAAFLLINPDGQLQSYLTAPHTPMQIINSIIKSKVFYEQNL
jgi:protein SCO1/2